MTPAKRRSSILIIDDDEQIRRLLHEFLSSEHDCVMADSAETALSVLNTRDFDLVISDINMGGISGIELVPLVLRLSSDTVVMIVSGQQTIDFAIESMRAGAFDYITKPLDLRQVEAAVRRALEHRQLIDEKRRYENHLEELVRERTAEIEHLAYHDQLTNLPNRELFSIRCQQTLASAQREGRSLAVLLVSLDRFKRIGDTLGYAAGDALLAEAAARIQKCLGGGDTLARFDSDEFAILLDRITGKSDVEELAAAINAAMKPVVNLEIAQEVFMTTSIGASLFPAHGADHVSIMRNAGAALDRAKQQGGNNYQFYTTDMNAQALTRLGLEMNLRRAVENNEFINYYQPIVNFVSTRPVGFEALVRWQHPRLGLLEPIDFIGLAENTGLILDIGHLVMRAACAQTRQWQEEGLGRLRIAANISARQFRDPSFVERVVQILGDTRLDAQCLELEITETSIMENSEAAIKVLTDIRKIGVRVSIDDFGTGYSSLSYLKHLPIDTVKLDRSFVNGATSDPKDAALVMSIITLSHNLNLAVIAEGVETAEQHEFLRLLRCDEGQGYLFGRPAPAEALDWEVLNATRNPNVVVTPRFGAAIRRA